MFSGIGMRMQHIKSYASIFLLLLFFLTPLSGKAVEEKALILGVVPQFSAREIRKIWSPIIKRLANEIGTSIIIQGSANIPEFEKQLLNSEFDIVYLNPYQILLANEAHGYDPVVRDVGRSLQGILVTKKQSGISSVKDLDNQTIAFPSPNAMGASLLVRAELHKKHNIKVLPQYVKSHTSVYLNVRLGNVVAGGGVLKTLNKQDDKIKNNLSILYKTQKVSSHPIAIHPRVSENIKVKLRKALLAMGDVKADEVLLSKIPIKRIGEATLADYLPLKKLGLDKYYTQ